MSDHFPTLGDWNPSTTRAAGIILRDQDGRILLQLRDINDRTVGPGLWSFFGGHIEGSEDLRTAALREFTEETALTLDPATLTPVARAQSFNGTQLYAYATTRPTDPSEIRLGEGAGFAFLTPDQIRKLDMIPAAGAILHHFLDNIRNFP